LNVRVIVVLLGALAIARANADAPRQMAAFGIALDATPDSVKASLAARYKPCRVVSSVYRHRAGVAESPIAAVEINPGVAQNDPGSLDLCAYSPSGDGVTDAIDARFTHPDVDHNQPLYSLEVFRAYPDVVYIEPPRVRVSFDDVRSELFRTYGKPIDQRRERIISSAANRATSLGIYKNAKREDYVVRYLWASEGRLPDVEHDDFGCDCTERYVKAIIEISQSPLTIPKNKFYALSVKLVVEDPDLRTRQAAWNAQWRQDKK
jgi:hypothetical protein